MKRLLIIALMLIAVPALAGVVSAQTWHTANSVTLLWDAPDPIDPTDTIRYQVYVKGAGAGAIPQAVGGEVSETQAVITFATEGRYYLCAETVRYPQGETEAQRSEIACSDEAANTQAGVPFGVKYFAKPNKPGKLRVN